MIDNHCHLEQKDYDLDREQVIEQCKKELKFVVSCCAHFEDIQKTLEIAKDYPNFVYTCFSLHPEYIKEITREQIDIFKSILKKEILERKNKKIVAIGETGLDYHWIKEEEWRDRQKELFQELINFSKELNLPLVIHSRDATDDCINILEKNNCKNVLFHLFSGNIESLNRVIKNDWYISIGPGIKSSKSYKKFARNMPLNRILLETDSPWWGFGKRNDPRSIKIACEYIAKEKNISFDEIEKQTDINSKEFFGIDKKIK